MRHLFFFLVLVASRAIASIPITDDFSKASEIAQAYNRPMVLLFMGSDWCEWSQKMQTEILKRSAFGDLLGNQFIFVKVDFPEINQQSEALLNQNQELREKFHVESFPTLVLLDSQGQEMTRLGYVAEEPESYARHLKQLFFDYRSLERDYKTMDFAKASIQAIEALYQRAAKLQSPHYMEKLLEVGLSADVGVTLPLEKYTQLVQSDQANTLFAETLKKKILERDPDNALGTHLRLALLDFQANEKNPEKAVESLSTYIADYGKSDKSNLWRLHLIISDYFVKQGKALEAKEHAEMCFKEAPEPVKSELLKILKSSRSVPGLNQE